MSVGRSCASGTHQYTFAGRFVEKRLGRLRFPRHGRIYFANETTPYTRWEGTRMLCSACGTVRYLYDDQAIQW